MVLIERGECERLLRLMIKAEGYCRNAKSTSQCNENDEPMASYPGANGYAGALLRELIQTIETAM
jgi:hypothetical protein